MKQSLSVSMFTVVLMFFAPFLYGDEAQIIQKITKQVADTAVPQGPFTANIVCAEQASHKIIIFRPDKDWNDPESVVWEWHAEQSKEIRPEHRVWFKYPDECKPVLGTSHLLMTASGGGVALVRLADKATLFYTHVDGNPHSAELLPDGNIVSISSGGLFTLYAVPEKFTGPDVKTVRYPCVGGHGVVWDNAKQQLWVLGYTEIAGWKYNFDKQNPALTKEISIPVQNTAAEYGHDFYPIPGTRSMFVTGVAVGTFNVDTHKLTTISNAKHIKSISMSPEDAVIMLEPTVDYWSDTVVFLNSTHTPTAKRKDAKIYKARWWIPNPFSAK